MKKRKPYKIIIAVLLFATAIAGLFLPYLHLPVQDGVSEGYVIDIKQAALNSDIISEVAKEEGIAVSIVYSTAKNIVSGKDRESSLRRLNEDEYYIIDILSEKLNTRMEEMEDMAVLESHNYSFFGLIKLSLSVITRLKQDIINAILIIMTMVTIVILSFVSGFNILCSKGLSGYRPTKIISIINILFSLLGLIVVNAIGIGALQIENFYKTNWGIGYFVFIFVNLLVLVLAVIGHAHEKYEGLITWKEIVKQKQLFLMTLPFIIYGLIFYYGPLVGWTMAFQNYKPSAAGSQVWVGWSKFIQLFTAKDFLLSFRNTVAMSFINLVLSFIFAIGFALLLNEVISLKGKKFVQTVSYLPHFLSWIIVAAIVRNLLTIDGGIINDLLVSLHIIDSPINFFADASYFWWIVGFSYVWKETGWNSIIYIASMTSINPDLYEAAAIDGAGRIKKMFHITLPSIKPTVLVLLIINLGMIMNSGFEAQYQLRNDLIRDTAEVIDTYVLRKSFELGADWSIGTAAGIFKSVVSILLVSVANRVAKVFGQERLY